MDVNNFKRHTFFVLVVYFWFQNVNLILLAFCGQTPTLKSMLVL